MNKCCNLLISELLANALLYDENGYCKGCRCFVGEHLRTSTVLKVKENEGVNLCNSSSPLKKPRLDEKIGVKTFTSSISVSDSDDECYEHNEDDDFLDTLEAPATSAGIKFGLVQESTSSGYNSEEEDEVEHTGSTGYNALSDFPHARENCAVYKFLPGTEFQKCPNCYCYVCDFPASKCDQWDCHCVATHTSVVWRQRRADVARSKNVNTFREPLAVISSLIPLNYAGSRPVSGVSNSWKNCGELLSAIEQVYPVEAPDPPGLASGIELRPYQRQSLAFMLDIERRNELGDPSAGRGGWLADEMGMGKTAVCAALILANPLKEMKSFEWYRLKATVVVTNTTLTKQWVGELKKFAPGLKVGLYYAGTKERTVKQKSELDVIVTTYDVVTRKDFDSALIFHRIIVDESHQGVRNNATYFKGQFVWCVTGTPFSSSLSDLSRSSHILGHWSGGCCLRDWVNARGSPKVVSLLRSVMIRHTKSQRIGGELALALPDSSTETVWLNMNDRERSCYQSAKLKRYEGSSPLKTFGLEMILLQRRRVCANIAINVFPPEEGVPIEQKTKLSYLIQDLDSLREVEPNMHAVVLTHHQAAFDAISTVLSDRNYAVCGVAGSIPVTRRHRNILEFQNSVEIAQQQRQGTNTKKAKVLVAMMKIGNIGITLTAASRVYLFEPCLDPQMEVQAAGRIHRLGQTQPVLVKKLVFHNSVESAILALHDAIKSGEVQVTAGSFPCEAIKIVTKT